MTRPDPNPDWLSVGGNICRPARPTGPTLAGLLASGAVTLAVESGEGSTPRQANALTAREDAWTANPACLVCAEQVDAWQQSGMLETATGPRVTHLRCFPIAVQTLLPTFTTSAARRRAED